MEKYVLLLHENPAVFTPLSPEEIQGIIARYKAWGQRLREAGKLVGSHKLEDGTARIMRTVSRKVEITDGPYAETKDAVGGFFIVEAANYDEAANLCRDCPHLEFGTIELRHVDAV